ncbi:hypothetical protein BX666DRAFT_2025730 [Dichotomocladium elegans]|nr:hypothetical protein BX666DRAFT_2025730 [Dichotomocladium elegans]
MSAAVFFYGTLMSPEVRNRVIFGSDPSIKRDRSVQIRPAILKGYKRYSLEHRDYPAIIFTGNAVDQVLGVLCEGLHPKDVARLDKFESYEYARQNVQVIPIAALPSQQVSVECGAYIWIGSHDHLVEKEWLLDDFLGSGIQAKWLEARCESYMIDQLEVHED